MSLVSREQLASICGLKRPPTRSIFQGEANLSTMSWISELRWKGQAAVCGGNSAARVYAGEHEGDADGDCGAELEGGRRVGEFMMKKPVMLEEAMNLDQEISLLSHGDQVERETWAELQPYLSKYEVVWRMLVVPLRAPGSIYLRPSINSELEAFAMNNYTAYVNMARALSKIEHKADDLKFSEEIWANLQRAVEVAIKAAKAFSDLYRNCTRKEAKISSQQLDSAETSVKIYRNRLHDPILATLKDENGTRLIPKRDKIERYNLWTKVMFDCDLTDFVPVERQLRDDFFRVCSSLQDFWTQIEKLSAELLQNAEYQRRTAAPTSFGAKAIYRVIDQDSSSGAISSVPMSASGWFNVSDSPRPLPSWFKSGILPK
jgi:hypothetical protein